TIEGDDLEDEIDSMETIIDKIRAELEGLEYSIVSRKNQIKDAQAATKKYETQLNDVKNNREFDAITKEVEIQGLEIQVLEKKIRETEYEITVKTGKYEKAQEDLVERNKDLAVKQEELANITGETEKEEVSLLSKAEKAEKNIDERLLIAYHRLRKNSKNGLAVVTIDRDSCSGRYNQIPPQRQLDIRQRKKIIVCEHCGRVLVDEEYAQESINS